MLQYQRVIKLTLTALVKIGYDDVKNIQATWHIVPISHRETCLVCTCQVSEVSDWHSGNTIST